MLIARTQDAFRLQIGAPIRMSTNLRYVASHDSFIGWVTASGTTERYQA